MKIALVEPAIMNVEPLGFAYLAQTLINNKQEVKYFEASRPNFLKRLKTFSPDILMFSVTTGKHRICQKLNEDIRKEINALSFFGGPHCTFYPDFINNSNLINGICRGEGEKSTADLINRLESGKDYTTTPGWIIRSNGNINKNPMISLIEDVDSIPFPNRDVIYEENSYLRNTPIKRIMASRGCPYSCSYCFNEKYNDLYKGLGSIYRQRTPESIVQEIKEIQKNYPVGFIKFADDIFGMRLDFKKFIETYGREINVPYCCNIRPNLVKEETASDLKKSGCVMATLAVESGNEMIRNRILNRKLSDETLGNAISILKKHGMRVWTQNIIGNPGESFEMSLQTMRFNAKHKVDFAECFLLAPFPGTEVYKYCVDNGYFDNDIEGLSSTYWLTSSLKFESARDKKRVINLQKFFSFLVCYPYFLPVILPLLEFPPNSLFFLFNRIHDGWRIFRIIRVKFGVKGLISLIISNLSFNITSFLKNQNKKSRIN